MQLIEAELSERIIGSCIAVNRTLGPEFLAGIDEEALAIEFARAHLSVERQKRVVIRYAGRPVGEHRLDFLVEGRVVLELKACKTLEDVHFAVARSYLRATGCSLALVTNFARPTLEVQRVVLTS